MINLIHTDIIRLISIFLNIFYHYLASISKFMPVFYSDIKYIVLKREKKEHLRESASLNLLELVIYHLCNYSVNNYVLLLVRKVRNKNNVVNMHIT